MDVYNAAKAGDLSALEAALDAHPEEINVAFGDHDKTPLFLAIFRDNAAAAKLLLNRGANFRAVSENVEMIYFAMARALDLGSITILRLLLSQMTAEQRKDLLNATAVFRLMSHGEWGGGPGTEAIVLALFLRSGLDPTLEHDGATYLHLACRNKDHFIPFLLQDGRIDINKAKEDGFTPLHVAALNGRVFATTLLLDHGADPFIKVNGQRPIDMTGSDEVATILNRAMYPGTSPTVYLQAIEKRARDFLVLTEN